MSDTNKLTEAADSGLPATAGSASSDTPETDALYPAPQHYMSAVDWARKQVVAQMERDRNHLRCDVVTLRVTARDYLGAAVAYQTAPWDLAIVRNYGAAKARMEAAMQSPPNVKALIRARKEGE